MQKDDQHHADNRVRPAVDERIDGGLDAPPLARMDRGIIDLRRRLASVWKTSPWSHRSATIAHQMGLTVIHEVNSIAVTGCMAVAGRGRTAANTHPAMLN